VAANSRIVGFLSGSEPDGRGRFLRDLQQWPDEKLETVHDFIQWMFPLREPSPVNPAAPVLDAETIAEIRARPELQQSLKASLDRMKRFYQGSAHWISPGNHNHLRLTRILKCLSECGLEAEAKDLFNWLASVYHAEQRKPRPGIEARTFEFWKSAVSY
jgi:hypothetical protein